jgi:2,3-dihydroxybenzoate decarboxylase
MSSISGSQVIAIEEHYLDAEVDEKLNGRVGGSAETRARLADLGELRLKEMDAAGIDIQVLSHCPPGAQAFDGDTAAAQAQGVNDRLYEVVRSKPDRFAAFASLPTRDPKGAADELERCVDKLGFKGAMLHGLTDGLFVDDKRFWPIFERAEALDVPIYVHPNRPHPAVIEAYYGDYAEKFPTILSSAWGFTVETATAGLRLVLSGIFDKHKNLKIILGHLGESLPFSLWRINHSLSKYMEGGDRAMSFRDIFCEHFYITTSGNFSNPALLCCVMEMGVDRILFSIDWPYVENAPGTEWMEGVPLGAEDREKILNGNAKRLLRM